MCRTLYICKSVNRRLKNSWRIYPQRKLNSENKVGWVREEYRSSGWNESHPSSLFPSFYPPTGISCICGSKVEVTKTGWDGLIKAHWIKRILIILTNYKQLCVVHLGLWPIYWSLQVYDKCLLARYKAEKKGRNCRSSLSRLLFYGVRNHVVWKKKYRRCRGKRCLHLQANGKGKGNVLPITGHEGPCGE